VRDLGIRQLRRWRCRHRWRRYPIPIGPAIRGERIGNDWDCVTADVRALHHRYDVGRELLVFQHPSDGEMETATRSQFGRLPGCEHKKRANPRGPPLWLAVDRSEFFAVGCSSSPRTCRGRRQWLLPCLGRGTSCTFRNWPWLLGAFRRTCRPCLACA